MIVGVKLCHILRKKEGVGFKDPLGLWLEAIAIEPTLEAEYQNRYDDNYITGLREQLKTVYIEGRDIDPQNETEVILKLDEVFKQGELDGIKGMYEYVFENIDFNFYAKDFTQKDGILVPENITVRGDSFKIVEQLSVDDNSNVYKAVNTEGKEVKVKILSYVPQESEKETAKTYQKYIDFLKEYVLLEKLRGLPGIVEVEGIGSYIDGGIERFFIVQEYIGESLTTAVEAFSKGKSYIEKRVKIIEIAKQMMIALEALHDEGILKTNLNENNIFYKDGQIKIVDFDLSGFLNTKDMEIKSFDRKTLEQIDLPISYIPESTLTSGKYSRESDMFALGVILFNLLKPEDGRLVCDSIFNYEMLSSDFDRAIEKIALRRKGVMESLARRVIDDPLNGLILNLLTGKEEDIGVLSQLEELEEMSRNEIKISDDAGYLGYDLIEALSFFGESLPENKEYDVLQVEDVREEVMYNLKRINQLRSKSKGEQHQKLEKMYEEKINPYLLDEDIAIVVNRSMKRIYNGEGIEAEKELKQLIDAFEGSSEVFSWANIQIKIDDLDDLDFIHEQLSFLSIPEGINPLNEENVKVLIDLAGNSYMGQIAAMAIIYNAYTKAKALPENRDVTQENDLKHFMDLVISLYEYLDGEKMGYPDFARELSILVQYPENMFVDNKMRNDARKAMRNGDVTAAINTLKEAELMLDSRELIAKASLRRGIKVIQQRGDIPEFLRIRSLPASASKMPASAAPELLQEELKSIVENLTISEDRKKNFSEDSRLIKNVNNLMRQMATIEDNENSVVLDRLRGKSVGEIRVVAINFETNNDLNEKGLADEVEALSYRDGDLLVIVINDTVTYEGKRIVDEYFNNDEAMEYLIRHEFLETILDVDHSLIKRFEMLENDGNALTVLNEIMIKHMTEEQMENIVRDKSKDPGDIFYEAIQVEKIVRADRGVLWAAKPGEYLNVVLIPLLVDQQFYDGSEYSTLKQRGKRVMSRQYGINTHVVYYSIDGSEDELGGQIKREVAEKISKMSEFSEQDKARIIVFATEDKAEFIENELSGYGDKLAGVC